ncbi:MAG TPA: hypothetical protein VH392_07980 [Sphingomicrobium sp.]|jgi:hypothetical protein
MAVLLVVGTTVWMVACGQPDPVADNAAAVNLPLPANNASPDVDAAPPENGAVTSAPPTAPAASAAAAIPETLHGRWGLAPDDCTSDRGDAKGLLVISATELRFYESRAVPSPGIEVRDGSIRGNFEFTGEGQKWTKFERLERNGSHLVRTESNPAASYTYGKC